MMGALYAAVIFLGVNNASSVQPVVAVERSVFYRERAAGMYSAMPYAMAQVCIKQDPYVNCNIVVVMRPFHHNSGYSTSCKEQTMGLMLVSNRSILYSCVHYKE